ncbi:MAG: DUF4199 domain-containing protein [Cyclobacteriaceae bacterium]|nr:DUF4199 domain-containing protein [Cyclobacteriaceae bacterium]
MLKSVPRLIFISVRNGLIAGLLGIVFLVALYYIGRHPFLFPIFFDFRLILFVVFMVIGLKELRDDHQQGILSFGEGMISTLIFTIIFASVTALLISFFCWLEPSFVVDYKRLAAEQLAKVSAQVIEQWGKGVQESNLAALSTTTGQQLALDYFMKSFIISFFISIIISVILRRQPKTN